MLGFLLFTLGLGTCSISTSEEVATGWDGGNPCIGRYTYGVTEGKPSLVEHVEDLGNGTCRLVDKERRIYIYESHDGSWRNSSIYSFDCNHGPSISDARGYGAFTDAFYDAVTLYDMFADNDWGRMTKISPNEHIEVYGVREETSYSAKEGLSFSYVRQHGHSIASYISALAHEFGHMFSATHGGLRGGEGSCLEESFADICAVMAMTYVAGEETWCFGKGCAGGCGRDIRNEPAKYSDYFPICKDKSANCQSAGRCSRIPSYAFTQLASSSGWDVRTAGQTFIWANRLLWSRGLTIKEAACGTLTIVQRMNINDGDTAAVVGAWAAVGIDLSTCPEKAPIFRLLNCETVIGMDAETDEEIMFKVGKPVYSKNANITVTVTNGSADVFVREGGLPTRGSSTADADSQTITIEDPSSNDPTEYYVMVYAKEAFTNLTIAACFTAS